MRRTVLTFAMVAAAGVAAAQAVDFGSILSNPQVQQALGQQIVGGAMANNQGNPAGGFSTMTPAQANTLAVQAQAIANKYLTKAEQDKLEAFQASPEGQAIIAKMPQMANELAPLLLQAYMGNPSVAPAAGTPKLPLTQPTGAK
jgi:hypothetical protein